MTGEAYAQSARIAEVKGTFRGYATNRDAMLGVMQQHRRALDDIDQGAVSPALFKSAAAAWNEAVDLGTAHGYRNAQATVLAPTGTIGFMMDCDTTGIEPDISLIKYKKLVGGGYLKMVNTTVPEALDRLGYANGKKAGILEHLEKEETIEGAPHMKDRDLAVFDCAFKPARGVRSIAPMGHVRMMAAVQPFLSGAISKTVNMPSDASVDDIANTYMESWRLGLKAVAIYRDGCKRSQPMNTSKDEDAPKGTGVAVAPARRRLAAERSAITHKFSVAGHEGYITVGLYDDRSPGEVFITMSKEGSTISGLMDSLATAISLSLQYGVPLRVLCKKFSHTRYEPSGFTGNKEIPIAKSITDYIFRWLWLRFGTEEDIETTTSVAIIPSPERPVEARERAVYVAQADAPSCADCGSIMVRNGACYKCQNCGSTSGCS
jgi:ribonucleoside-diphosphate reductase alpha chain